MYLNYLFLTVLVGKREAHCRYQNGCPAARLQIVCQRIKVASGSEVLRGLVSNPIGAVRLGRQVDFRDRTGKARTAAG